MEDYSVSYLFISLLTLIIVYKFYRSRICPRNLPPSPPAFPIIGHLRLLKQPLHRTLHHLTQKYGPIISLQFGRRPVVIVSSSAAVEECFTKNDVVLANRPGYFLIAKHISYNNSTMSQSPYGDHWRNLRRIGTLEIFSTNRLNMLLNIRKDEINRLVVKLSQESLQDFAKVELKSKFKELTFNVIMRMVAGKRYYGEDVSDEEEGRQFREIMDEILGTVGTSNPGDFLPILNWVDGGRFERKVIRLGKRVDKFMQNLIDEHRNKENLESMNTMIDHLLGLQESQPEYYTDKIIKGLMLIMIFAGTDTSSVTLEWTMSNLLNHPNILMKARDEIDNKVGKECVIEESHLSKLPYLQNIILETLRLYPATPLLAPHMSSADCMIGGYNVPRGTMLLVNAWAIHRDPTLWDDPLSYKPERFDNKEKESYKLMPFGLGRRSCPGEGLAHRVMGLALGTLIQCFEWKKITDKEIDMVEGPGLTMPKAEALEALCKARPILNQKLSQLV